MSVPKSVQRLVRVLWSVYNNVNRWSLHLPTYREAFVHGPMLSPLCAITSKTDSVCGTSPDFLSKTILVVELSTVISSKCSLLSGLNRMWYLLTSDQELWVPVPTFGGGSHFKVTDGTFMSTSVFRF